MRDERSLPERGVGWLPWVALLPAFAFGLRELDNADTWWHLASGRFIFEHRMVPAVDTLSFTVPDHAWINLPWGFDLLLFAIERAGGVPALVLLSATVHTAAVALMVVRLCRASGPVAAALLAGWAVFVAQERFAVRPEMFTLLLLQVILLLLEWPGEARSRRMALVPLTLLVWVNLHALFAVGLAVAGCAALVALLDGRLGWPGFPRRTGPPTSVWRGRVVAAAALAAGVTLLNPYLLRGALFPLELVSRFERSSAYASISEFRSPFFAWWPNLSLGALQLGYLASVAIVLATLALGMRAKRGPRLDLFGASVFAMLALLALAAQRNGALFALGVAPIVGRCLPLLAAHLPRPPAHRPVRLAAAGFVAMALVAMAWAAQSNEYYRLDGKSHAAGLGVLDARVPDRAVAFFRECELPGRLYNDLSLGGYLAWDPPLPDGVFIDGRLEVYDDFFAEYRAGLADFSVFRSQVERYGIESAMVFHRPRTRHQLIGHLRASPEWDLVYHDETVVLFVRRAGNEAAVQRARDAFAGRDADTRRRLREPGAGWRYPQGQALATIHYARVLELIGDRDAAAEFFERAVGYGLPRLEAASYYRWLAAYSASRGDLARARDWSERARAADPRDTGRARGDGDAP